MKNLILFCSKFKIYINDNGQVEIVGTPLFMAPEIKNGSHYSFSIDVCSFGIIAYYIYNDQFQDEKHPVDMNQLVFKIQ